MKKKILYLVGSLIAVILFVTLLSVSSRAQESDCPPENAGVDFKCVGRGACRVETQQNGVFTCDGIPDDMSLPIED